MRDAKNLTDEQLLSEMSKAQRGRSEWRLSVLVVLVALGAIGIFDQFFFNATPGEQLAGLAFVALVLCMLLEVRRRQELREWTEQLTREQTRRYADRSAMNG